MKNKLLLLLLMLTCGISAAWAQQHVAVASTTNGSVSVDKPTPTAGEVVTVTVAPSPDYQIAKSDIVVEATINPGSANAPGQKVSGPAVGYKIELQGNDPDDLRTERTYTFTMPSAPYNVLITATFTAVTYYDVIVAEGIENGTVVPDKNRAIEGEKVNLTVTPNPGYKLNHLYVNGGQVSATDNENGTYTYTFDMPAENVTINAVFSQKLFYVTKAPTENGSFDISMTGGFMGDFVEIYPTPDAGYTVDQVTVTAQDGTQVEVTQTIDRFRFTMPASDVTVAMTFKLAEYTITVAALEHGTVTAPTTAHFGDAVQLTVNPAPGYQLETLTYTVEGSEPVAIENNTFTMPAANVTINATFKVIEYYYEVEEEVGCTILDETNYHYSAPAGATITLRIVPDNGKKLKQVVVNKVTGDGPEQVVEEIEHTITVENDVTYLSFVMPAGNVKIHVICADEYAVSVTAGDHGSAEADMITAYEGETVTVTTYPNAGYKVNEIYYINSDNERVNLTEAQDVSGKYTFIMPAEAVNVVVTFKTILDYYQLKFDAESTGGTVSVDVDGTAISSMDQVAEFSSVRVTVTPAAGYEIESFKVYEGLLNADDDLSEAHEVTYVAEDDYYRFDMPRTNATILVSFKMMPTYTITVADGIEHGTVTAPAAAYCGEEVKVTIKEDPGYRLETLTYTVEGSEPVAIENNTFNMPEANVTLNATFVQRPPLRGDLNGDGKVDVQDLTKMVNIILGKDSPETCVNTPYLNNDTKVDVGDLNIIVNIILGKE